jgi:hypothetical protein
MRVNNLKLNEHTHLSDQVAQFLAQGGAIESVPTNIYKHEELSQTNVRTLLETSVGKLSAEQRKPHGDALRKKDRQAWTLREMKA